jgi:hypothetical protein
LPSGKSKGDIRKTTIKKPGIKMEFKMEKYHENPEIK